MTGNTRRVDKTKLQGERIHLTRSWICAVCAVLVGCSARDHITTTSDASVADATLSCMTGETTCPSGCVDTRSNAQNCGICEHSCGQGSCAQAQCDSYVIADRIDRPLGIAVDATYVYWSSLNGDLRKAAKDNRQPSTTLVPAVSPGGFSSVSLVLDDLHLYWGQRGTLLRTSLSDGASMQIGAIGGGFYGSSILVDSMTIFWLAPDGSIMMRPKSGAGDALALIRGVAAVALAQSGSDVYWTDSTPSQAPSIRRISKMQPAISEDLADLSTSPLGIAVDTDTVYWTDQDGAVWRMSTSTPGAQPQQLAAGPPPAGYVAVDRNTVYWVAGALDANGMIMSVPKQGGGTHVQASVVGAPGMLAVDDMSTVFTDLGASTPIGTTEPNTGAVMRVIH